MKTKRLAIALSLLLVFVMLFSHLFVIAEADHDCSGEDCPVCAVIALCQNTLKVLGEAFIAAVAAFACLRFATFVISLFHTLTNTETPISLKVKLLN